MIDLFGEEREPIAPKKGRQKRKTMQETYGILDGFTLFATVNTRQ